MLQKYEPEFDSKIFLGECFEQKGDRLPFLREIGKSWQKYGQIELRSRQS